MNQQEKETFIQKAVRGKTLSAVYYYLINRRSYFFPDQPEQLVDAAVELVFADESRFSMGMDFHHVAIDAFDRDFGSLIRAFKPNERDVPFVKLDVSADKKWETYIGKNIVNAQVTWNWYEDLDEVRHFIPQDIELEFGEGLYAALCTTSYTMDEDGISILAPDSEGEILVLFSEEDTRYFKRGKYYDPAAFEHLGTPTETPDFGVDDDY